MRGERPVKPLYTMASVVDLEGQEKFYILPGKLITVGLISMGLLFVLAVTLAAMILKNKIELDNLKQQVTIEDNREPGTQR